MSKIYYMGVDVGSSNTKVVLFDLKGKQIHDTFCENALYVPGPGMVECDPGQVFDGMLKTMKQCLDEVEGSREALAGIGLSTHGHSIIALDKNGDCLTRGYMWGDIRASKEAREMDDAFAKENLYQRTGAYVRHPLYPIGKILWMQKDAHLWSQVDRLAGIKDYIVLKLYGEFLVDYAIASCTGMMNVHSHQWDDVVMKDVLKIPEEMLAKTVSCQHTLKGMKKEYAAYLGIRTDLPFTIGSADGMCATVGSGIFDERQACCSIGTSGAVRTMSGKPRLDEKRRTWCYGLSDDRWVLGGAINNGGLALRWLRDTYLKQYKETAEQAGKGIYELFSRYAEETPIGSDGLVFLPYFTGERSPDWNDQATGIMYGMTLQHNDKHIIRAAMEGVLYRLYSVFLCMKDLGCDVHTLKVNGGYAKSDSWLKMQADLFDVTIEVMEVTETAALGAAYMSMLATGALKRMGDSLDVMKNQRFIYPDEKNHVTYQTYYQRAMDVYDRLYPTNQ